MKSKVLRVGFDLDGVLLYNPARIYRPVIAWIKKNILNRDINKFYYPRNKFEQMIWGLLHKSSLWPAPGLDQLKQLIQQKKISAYIVSARYESLQSDFHYWIKKINHQHLFSGYYYNNKNEQPYVFKERLIRDLKLDIFVEDNWDIVQHLNHNLKRQQLPVNIFWIYNLLDRTIPYQYKFPDLKSVIAYIEK